MSRDKTTEARDLANLRRRVSRARNKHGFAVTCPASRHLHIMADCLSMWKRVYPMLQEEPEHCAGSIYAVLERLWKAEAELLSIKGR